MTDVATRRVEPAPRPPASRPPASRPRPPASGPRPPASRAVRGGPTRIAIAHDYFTQRGGAERVVERLARLFEPARVYTSVADLAALPPSMSDGTVATTPLQLLRRAGIPLQALAPVMAGAFGALDLGNADLVISSSSAFAHHVRPGAGIAHVCYCHTPPRFLWELDEYFGERRAMRRLGSAPLALMRHWDSAAAQRVTTYLANSAFTAERIRRTYGREARIVYPPIDTALLRPSRQRSERFLVVARLRPHKRIDLAIAAAAAAQVPLDVIGDGSDRARLQALAGPNVRFLGRRSDGEVADAMAACAGLIVPGIEDFGMTTAEVQAAGRPPIAFAGGGSAEIVRDGETGFLVGEQTVEAFSAALMRAVREPLDPDALVSSAARFDARIFDATMRTIVAQAALPEPAPTALFALPSTDGLRPTLAPVEVMGMPRAAAARDPEA